MQVTRPHQALGHFSAEVGVPRRVENVEPRRHPGGALAGQRRAELGGDSAGDEVVVDMQLPQGRDAAQLGGDAAGDRVPAEQQSLQAGQLAELRRDGAGEGVPPEVQQADLREAPQPPREAPPQL